MKEQQIATREDRVLRRGMHLVVRAAREQPRAFAAGTLGSLAFAAATVGAAYVLSAVVARLAGPAFSGGGFEPEAAVLAAAVTVAVAAVKLGGILVRRLAVGRMQYGLTSDYRRRVLRRYLDLSFEWHLRQSPGVLLSRAGSDVDVAWAMVADLPLAVGASGICVLAAAALLLTDPVLAAVGITIFPVIIAMNVVYSRAVAAPSARLQERRAELAEIAHESVEGAQVVRILHRRDSEVARFARAAVRLRDAVVRVERTRAIFEQIVGLLPQAGTLVLLLVGAVRLRDGAIGVEQLLSATLLFSAIAFPLSGLAWLLAALPASAIGYARVRETLDLPGEPADGPSPDCEAVRGSAAPERSTARVTDDSPVPRLGGYPGEPTRTALALRTVTARRGARTIDAAAPTSGPGLALARLELCGAAFAYSAGRFAVQGVSVTVRPGHVLAITGPTGSGKTTLVRLIAGLLVPGEGSVHVDGLPPRLLCDTGELPDYIGYVPQDVFLFGDTVRGNVALDREADFPDERLWEVLRTVRADDFVAALPDGLDSSLAERGDSLSGGQRQRLALARAAVRRPRLLVLDDATSGLDASIEASVLGSLRKALPVTTVVVTSRPQSLALANEVLFLDNGGVAACGAHSELLRTVPEYRRLVRQEVGA